MGPAKELKTSEEKFDAVLRCLNEANIDLYGIRKNGNETSFTLSPEGNRRDLKDTGEISLYLLSKGIKIDLPELNLILGHLSIVEETVLLDYRIYNSTKEQYPSYRILYKGKVLIERGGYEKKRKKEKWQNRWIIFTKAAAIIGFAILLWNTIDIKLLKRETLKNTNYTPVQKNK